MPDQVRHDDAITGWPALTQGPHSIIIVSIETRWECDMADLFENPLGLAGFEFVEFSAPQKGIPELVFEAMGFTLIATHRSNDVQLWRSEERRVGKVCVTTCRSPWSQHN